MTLSQGTIGNLLPHSAQQCQGIYEAIKEQLAQSEVVGADETGAKVKGKKWWIWAWQNALNTFIVASDNRGSKTIDAVWPDGLPTATLVSDRWAAHLKMAANHQPHRRPGLLAHLLREVIFLGKSEAHWFATDFKAFLLSVLSLCETLRLEQQACGSDSARSLVLEHELNRLLSVVVDKATHPQTAIFQASIRTADAAQVPSLSFALFVPSGYFPRQQWIGTGHSHHPAGPPKRLSKRYRVSSAQVKIPFA